MHHTPKSSANTSLHCRFIHCPRTEIMFAYAHAFYEAFVEKLEGTGAVFSDKPGPGAWDVYIVIQKAPRPKKPR